MRPRHENATLKTHKNFWGPSDDPPFVLEENYQEYSKSEKIGKIADWISSQEKKNTKSTNQQASSSIFAYVHDEDDEFTTVNSLKPQRNLFNKNRPRFVVSRYQKTRETRGNYTRNNYTRGKKGGPQYRGRYGDRYHAANYWFRKPSVLVRETWRLIEDIDYSALTKLVLPTAPTISDIYLAGAVSAFDKSYEYLHPQQPVPLKPCNHLFHKVPTCEDPIIRSHISEARVFVSDSIISTLMACTRSVAPWDILIHRVSDVLFLDKRPDSDIELLTVNETSNDPGFDHQINSPTALTLEATTVNQYFSQQCLLSHSLKREANKNPFFEEESSEIPSVTYKYRLFDLGDDIKVMVRCEYEAYGVTDKQCINIKSLLEWGTKPGMKGWKDELEKLSGSILATEIKNNSNKFAKWTASAIITGDNLIKIGFVSRNHYMNTKEHSILGTINIASRDLVSQIGLNMKNAWGIIFSLSKTLLALPEGKYVLMKDSHK
ncbi:hypothetical protein HZS_7097, partial [Henneguya salminicola]